MANIAGMYNPDAEPQKEFGAIPTGDYPGVMIDSDVKTVNPPKTGKYLETTYEIIEGEFKGRKLWHNITLVNPSDIAVEIGGRQMASIRHATGAMHAQDSQEFHNKPMLLRVEFIPAGTVEKNGYRHEKDKNEIKAWKKIGDAPAAPAHATSQPAANAAPASGAPPWANRAA